jgi:excisionase family DNA binding protein
MPLLRHHLARFSAKLFAINSSHIPPQHKPPSGAKSGLADRIVARLEASFQTMLRQAIAADRLERQRELSKMTGPKTNDVFTLKEAAGYLGMKPERLREACRGERIAFVRHNRRYAFKRSDLDDFLTTFWHPRKSVFR